jgi:hypothetical protein
MTFEKWAMKIKSERADFERYTRELPDGWTIRIEKVSVQRQMINEES